jgi:glycosyltransferase involved in cell wall biosynthesis
MRIGFDAKRAYHNQTGLGHYSRTLIHSLSEYFPGNDYFLFNPKPSPVFSFNEKNIHEVRPSRFLSKIFPSAWRSSWVSRDMGDHKIDIYHGLSHEVPQGLPDTKTRSVVTMHDLIHERYPEQYSPVDVRIYRKKFRYACIHANHIIAISQQTKKDLLDMYRVPEEKITVCYQSCNPAFARRVSEEEKIAVSRRYELPSQFFLYVGSVIERKNLLNICKAIFLLRGEIDIPLVVIGQGGKYLQLVRDYVKQNGLEKKIIFLSEHPAARDATSFQDASDFPAIYQSAVAMIYPSFFEGFGIPVLEALWARLPVITSNVSCLPEAGGNAALYVNPHSAEEIAAAMKKIYLEKNIADGMREKGWVHAQAFTPKKSAEAVMEVYLQLQHHD